ncbi:ADP-ribosylglycohydrolase family protein [Candidatus Methylobacter favarea]|uniref:ADP-ribosylglycohydrolase family protein n=1 Tax=Candidatus Methylobacter favarea TaxID=2707345 RepID=A0A8S0Y6P4_9GAMM|nr:ADP-ribosylglycohydrolase family protein [Candidatus Methylobacter favarea]CAA9891837.1 ADP-ribosylglycohydrolase family protein [Candidatus Methylobacter favarea]
MDTLERFRGCLLGLAIGDAVGTTLEFKAKGSFTPITDMVGGGPFRLKPGQWTDDTAMALCLATSLLECQGFDADDQMQRYCRWHEEGYLSSNGRCFDIGNTVSQALRGYQAHGNPYAGSTDSWSAGNGSLMRLAPIPLFYYAHLESAVAFAADSSRTTHGAQECIEACRLYSRLLLRALAGEDKEQIVFSDGVGVSESSKIAAIANGDYRDKHESAIRGTGYVVDCLEAALWCFWSTDSFSAAILKAANLGDDADTTAAVCGQLAGAYYGSSGLPAAWMQRLAKRDLIQDLADRLYQHSQACST